MELPFF